jgi:hypothetical protein
MREVLLDLVVAGLEGAEKEERLNPRRGFAFTAGVAGTGFGCGLSFIVLRSFTVASATAAGFCFAVEKKAEIPPDFVFSDGVTIGALARSVGLEVPKVNALLLLVVDAASAFFRALAGFLFVTAFNLLAFSSFFASLLSTVLVLSVSVLISFVVTWLFFATVGAAFALPALGLPELKAIEGTVPVKALLP